MSSINRLVAWARLKRERYFEVRYIGPVAGKWAIDLHNEATQAAVHVDGHDTLKGATYYALLLAAKDSYL